jgi:hypothetical protein
LETASNKSKVMAFEGKHPRRSKIVIDNKIIEQVSHFNCLGCDVSYNYDADLQIKLYKVQRMCGTIECTVTNKTRKDTQLKFYKFMAVPTLLYGCETWALNRSDKRKIETAEMRFSRHVAGYTRRDEISDLTIRRELQIFNTNDKIKGKKKEWHDHIQQTAPYRTARKAAEYKPTIGHRDVGRPKRKWEDDF